MSTWTNIVNTSNAFKIFYADAVANNMSGDFCKEYRVFNNLIDDAVILDANSTVGSVGNCRVECMLKNTLVPDAYVGNFGNTPVVSARIHLNGLSEYQGIFLLYDGARTFSICYGKLNEMQSNLINNTVISHTISTVGTVQIRWDVITTTDNMFILTKLEQYVNGTWAKLAITGFNIPEDSYRNGLIGIGSTNLIAGSPLPASTFFDAVKIYLPA